MKKLAISALLIMVLAGVAAGQKITTFTVLPAVVSMSPGESVDLTAICGGSPCSSISWTIVPASQTGTLENATGNRTVFDAHAYGVAWVTATNNITQQQATAVISVINRN